MKILSQQMRQSKVTIGLPIIFVIYVLLFFHSPLAVPVCVIVILLFLWLRDEGMSAIGFIKPNMSVLKLFSLSLLVALVITSLYLFVLYPIVVRMTGQPIDLSKFEQIRGNATLFLISIPSIWVLAGFGEESFFVVF
jgi:membrane protease YdiL (CAAX protease family)